MNLHSKGSYLLGAIALTGLLAGCAADNPWGAESDSKGKIHLSLQTDGEVKSARPVFRSGEDGIQAADYLTLPAAEDFKIKLEKKDGTYSGFFNSIDELNASDMTFAAGAYTITAYSGEKGKQGFECPYFEGTSELSVLSDQTTDIDVTAALANSMIVLEYTQQFKDYMSAWDATIFTEGVTGGISYSRNETRAAFVEPNNVGISLSFTTNEGKSTMVQVCGDNGFAPLAKTLYHITIDVKAKETGDAALSITFDDTLVEEAVEIDLTDELFTTPAPTIEAVGFSNGETIDMLEETASDATLKMNVIAKAGLAKAILTINSDKYNPSWGKEIDLCAATPAQQTSLTNAGISAVGFFKNPDKLAFLDLTEFGKSLPKGTHTIQLRVEDKQGAVSEATSVVIDSQDITIEVVDQYILFGSNEATMTLNYNGTEPEKNVTFEAINEAGDMEPVTIKKCELATSTRAFETKTYIFTLELKESTRSIIEIHAFHKGKAIGTFNVPITSPEYAVEADAYANSADLKISSDNSTVEAAIVSKIQVRVQGGDLLEVAERKTGAGIVSLKGLTPNHPYIVETSLDGTNWGHTTTFTTEAELDVPNGDFENTSQTISATFDQGGPYTRTLIGSSMQNKLKLTVNEPTGWGSINPKTCNLNASKVNSWYCQPSTYSTDLEWVSTVATQAGMGGQKSTPDNYKNFAIKSGNKAVVVRNVAWDATGADLSLDKKTAGESNYYCTKVPTIKSKSAGKLFLGTYSWNGSADSFKEGVAFASRPKTLKGWYQYKTDSQDTGEKGTVRVSILNGTKTIGEGSITLGAASSYTQFEIPIKYNTTFAKATELRIMITSSDRSENAIKTTNHCSLYEQESYGAQLLIDNLTFSY